MSGYGTLTFDALQIEIIIMGGLRMYRPANTGVSNTLCQFQQQTDALCVKLELAFDTVQFDEFYTHGAQVACGTDYCPENSCWVAIYVVTDFRLFS